MDAVPDDDDMKAAVTELGTALSEILPTATHSQLQRVVDAIAHLADMRSVTLLEFASEYAQSRV